MSLVPYVHVATSLQDGVAGDEVALTENERHHLRRVLRLPDGAEVEVADGVGHHAAARLRTDVLLLTGAATSRPLARPELWVAQALPKGRKLDEVVRQTTELGVDGIVVVAAQHSVTRVDPTKLPRLHQRWEGVARAACEQARRPRRPQVVGPVSSAQLGEEPGTLVVAHPGGAALPTVLGGDRGAERVTLAIGPEGGWSDAEVAAWQDAGVVLAGLGPTVLRTEHAAAAALAVAAATYGRW